MDSRERTFLALDHQEPDRVPRDFWASTGTMEKIARVLALSREEFLDLHDVDLRYIEGPRYVGPALDDRDIWGVPRSEVRLSLRDGIGEFSESYREVVRSPLEGCGSVGEVLDYPRWPDPDWYDYSGIEAQCDALRDRGRVVVFMGDRLNRLAQLKPAMYLRGAQQIFIDLAENPEIAGAMFHRIGSFYREYGARILESARGKIDILCTGDDFGAQNGPLISPDMWNRFLGKGFASFIGLGHAFGVRVMHHTCGAVAELVPAMIDCGLDILQALQPEAAGMAAAGLKTAFGRRLAFHGGVSIQQVLPHGTGAEVREHVRRLLADMKRGGGYIACSSHNIQADTPLGNIEALLRAYADFGGYGSRAEVAAPDDLE